MGSILTNMHREILTQAQIDLLPLIKRFSETFYLVGGTAIALQLGHRRSIDFDLFTEKTFSNIRIEARIKRNRYRIERVIRDEAGQYTFLIDGVSMTFFAYPFTIPLGEQFESIIRMPDLLTLAAMKAFALARRAKWKDYVDLYFIIERAGGMTPLIKHAQELFGNEFNERLFREQLSYFDDINYREEVIYLPGFETDPATIRQTLTDFALAK